MEFRNLRAFYLVARYGSLRRAANHLKLTLPAVSVQIKKLESELGVGLFHHRPNKLILTERGRAFLKEVNCVFEALERAREAASREEDSYSKKISISLGSDIAKFFASQIAAFIREHPKLSVTLLGRPSPETLSLVIEGEVDLGVGRFERLPRGVQGQKLLEDGVSLVFLRGHPLSRVAKIRLTDLLPYRMIALTRNTAPRKAIDYALMHNGIEIQNILEVGSCPAALELARRGLGVGLVHNVCIAAERDRKIACVDMSQFFGKTEVALIYRTRALLTPAHHALIEILVKNAQNSH
jgi:DNA-binding transcriptional LysR family regulator